MTYLLFIILIKHGINFLVLCSTKYSPKVIQAKTRRRNTIDSLYFTELVERSENSIQQETGEYHALMETENMLFLKDFCVCEMGETGYSISRDFVH